ncbi:MAG: nuclease-related domain-containing protein [Alphaproteobacteria bacterium]|nr:nuclease-related domain-containing protein [Alphaproteobacteria bacterium]
MFSKTDTRSPLSGEIYRVPGQWLDERIQDLAFDCVVEYLFVAVLILFNILVWLQQLTNFRFNAWILSIFTVPLIGCAVFDFFKIRGKIGNHKLGRDGEREVAHHLQNLIAKGYCILHDIDTGRANIDHILIGPSGIYTIETKAWRKPLFGPTVISYDDAVVRKNKGRGYEKPIRQAKAESKLVQCYLSKTCGRSFDVRPLVVFVGWFVEQPSNVDSLPVWALHPEQIPFYLNKSRKSLSQDDIKLVTYHLSRLSAEASV